MSIRGDGDAGGVWNGNTSRRQLLAVGGLVAAGSLAGCLGRVASAVTNTGASPAAVFAGSQSESSGAFVVGRPHVSRLTPSLAERVEVEGWVTSSPVMAQNHNSSRSNAPGEGYARDADADDDGLGDGSDDADDDLEALYEYLGGEAMVAERFTVCLPDAEVPGGNGSIEEAVTPERLLSYLTGELDGEGRVYSWGAPKAGPDGGGDCDDNDREVFPDAVCGTTPHFVAEVTGPVSTGGGLVAHRASDGTLLVSNDPAGEQGASVLVCPAEGEPFEPVNMQSWGARGDGVPPVLTQQGRVNGVTVAQVTVQPPGCPRPFPALFYVGRAASNDQLVYTGGWVIDDASLYEGSSTVLSVVDDAPVFGVATTALSDLGATFEDVAGGDVRRRIVMRRRRGARLDRGPVDELVERGVLSEGGKETADLFIRKKPGGRQLSEDGGYVLTHLPLDAPVLHLTTADGASNEVKFKAGAELSKAVN
ncbi:hypothetical protein [Salinirubrum litoreum]|uniref:Secreted protein n=1 Tax=Salinirubrum litoreum TaxID=1126234 RepID=A0ABD5RBB8_9EURY|nr:hypothetical protein [Salinirubrum litoreum]